MTEAEKERAAVVAWMLNDADKLNETDYEIDRTQAEAIRECARAIERREHLKRGG